LLEACPASCIDRTLAPASDIERAFDETIETVDHTSAPKFGKNHFFFLAGLEADGCAGGDIQAHTVREGAFKCESAVRFEEVIVAANLDGTVTRVLDEQSNRPATHIRLYRPGRFIKQKFSRSHALSFELHSLVNPERPVAVRLPSALSGVLEARSAGRNHGLRTRASKPGKYHPGSRAARWLTCHLSSICPPAARAN
jgi:hypothetical protein